MLGINFLTASPRDELALRSFAIADRTRVRSSMLGRRESCRSKMR
jgi:hypothetical protein